MPDPHTPPADPRKADFLSRFLDVEVPLYRYVCAVAPVRQDARDIVQETALALWEIDGRYDTERPFLPWALSVARNKVRQHAARAGRFPSLLEDESLLELILAEQEAYQVESSARQAKLMDCLQKLPDEHARLVRHYYWDRLHMDELAVVTQLSTEAIYKRLQRIRALLMDCILRTERKEIS